MGIFTSMSYYPINMFTGMTSRITTTKMMTVKPMGAIPTGTSISLWSTTTNTGQIFTIVMPIKIV
jgi:hypothetical protein